MKQTAREASWKVTVELLEKARQQLDCNSDLSQYQEYLNHNELELALDELVAIGQRSIWDRAYWRALSAAATNMKLTERVEVCERLAKQVV